MAGFAKNDRMPDLPEPEPKSGTSLFTTNTAHIPTHTDTHRLYVQIITDQLPCKIMHHVLICPSEVAENMAPRQPVLLLQELTTVTTTK